LNFVAIADPTDANLATRALAGDEAGYAGLMARHREAVYRLARAHGGENDAMDIVQSSFIAAFDALRRYDSAKPFRPWLLRIALNKCRDRARRNAVRAFFLRARPMDEALDIADPAPAIDRQAADRQMLARAMAALSDLPASLKEPLILCAIEGMMQEETAALLGLSTKAVEMRLYRARAALRKKMGGVETDGA